MTEISDLDLQRMKLNGDRLGLVVAEQQRLRERLDELPFWSWRKMDRLHARLDLLEEERVRLFLENQRFYVRNEPDAAIRARASQVRP